jgi:hypothetical protein
MRTRRLKEILKVKAYKDLCKFMAGQTTEMKDGEVYIYEDDFIRWFNKQAVID